jgi:IS30 family transposase
MREVARALGRVVSTVSDEVARNSTRGSYDPAKAQRKAYARRHAASWRGKKIVERPGLRDFVERELMDDQSPGAVSGRIRLHEPSLSDVSKDTIYRYVASPHGRKVEHHRGKLKRGKHRRSGGKRRLRDGRTFIDKRPKSIGQKPRVGDAEGDFIVSGRSGHGVLFVAEDMRTRAPFLERILVPSADAVLAAARRIKRRYPEWSSMTTDNDLLFVHHEQLARELGIRVYFCFPGHPWEKPQVENLNGRVRAYVPKGSDISKLSPQRVRAIEAKMNGKFMAVLGYATPREALEEHRKRKQRRSAAKKGRGKKR